ncbi:uncharacterized protein CANTADRAFT_44505 [Suhomyces tanzawaensis NRRL Y-17324]|uniref:Putative lipoate-protein ligase A n=1 Tax=Suhomyces tanzawaensis NRRL Y-17324 TaxID=984487 RepID=A0A1E4SR21_9ASCO|nr:uncharacterized protein CANTADRAFT_44505 [Suhomyces tanzawaensis NRRL Y-17324]ODV81966.1 hypothetical protein CANTADRAFT_44505 [Suhomyces tanzawaensis NRRL Y-17324]
MFRHLESYIRLRPLVLNRTAQRSLNNVQLPFQDDLTAADSDDFGLSDFQHYQESPEIVAKRQELSGFNPTIEDATSNNISKVQEEPISFEEQTKLKRPAIFVSKLSNPYTNLAIEDYVYNNMPIPTESGSNFNRLMFYTNSPCVVIGKNQNPWKEVNIPLLNSLHIPLVRRKSGGGTVVHDMGNVNYSFMTTKAQFDRFQFAELVVEAVNNCQESPHKIQVNERGDIVTVTDGINYKISGSAYKLSKGKSYHHGTMLLNLRLDILGKLLSRDENAIGKVESKASIASVKSKVTNLGLSQLKFIEVVSRGFTNSFGKNETIETHEADEYDQNELFGLTDFVEANTDRSASSFIIDETTELPDEIIKLSDELREWSWRYGSSQSFSHEITNHKLGFTITFHVGKHGVVESFELQFNDPQLLAQEKIEESFEFLQTFVEKGSVHYRGSDIAGFITNDMISDWVGECIDNTV